MYIYTYVYIKKTIPRLMIAPDLRTFFGVATSGSRCKRGRQHNGRSEGHAMAHNPQRQSGSRQTGGAACERNTTRPKWSKRGPCKRKTPATAERQPPHGRRRPRTKRNGIERNPNQKVYRAN